jgi:cell division protein YceG involved in septum cleavage
LICTTIYAKKNSPVEISPIFNQYDSISVQSPLKICIKTVSIADSIKNLPLGQTRTARKTFAQIISKPSIDTVIHQSLGNFLKNKKLISSEDSADFILDLTILNARINEITRGLTQVMSAELTVEVLLSGNKDSTQIKKYIIEAKNSREALDTTKLAGDIFRETVKIFIQELMKNLMS